jgi:hypothetical protein
MRSLLIIALLALLSLTCVPAFAQDPQVTGDRDGSSQQVEESDEAYRRRMELEDARRSQQPTYTDPGGGYQREPEKIDKLPPESRENIRDQLVDIIMENPDWEPSDALQEYPYEPTEAALANASLLQQEQEAWDEQVEKYHAREAEAFGAYRGPVAGPGNPDGSEGGEQGQAGEQGQDGGEGQQGGEGGQQGGDAGSQGQAGTYQPYQSSEDSAEDAVSTAGVSESALDFLRTQRAPAAGNPAAEEAGAAVQARQQGQQQEQSAAAESGTAATQAQAEGAEAADETDMRGIIAIEDLDKLEGAGGVPVARPPPEDDEENEGD